MSKLKQPEIPAYFALVADDAQIGSKEIKHIFGLTCKITDLVKQGSFPNHDKEGKKMKGTKRYTWSKKTIVAEILRRKTAL